MIIDMTTALAELIQVDNKMAVHIAHKFKTGWLACYPRLERCIHDQGTEFKGFEFQAMLQRNGVKPVLTMVKNPQANGACE